MINTQVLFTWIGRAIVLFTAMPIHEFSHGFTADKLGDPTARENGRLTLNPLAHLDLLGSLLIVLAGFGWAKPVPVDPRHFKHPKRDMALTALAGPLSNILLAFVAMLAFKILYGLWPVFRNNSLGMQMILLLLETILFTNLGLAVFNLLPVPPLDGSKVLGALLPARIYYTIMRYERYIGLILIVLIWQGILTKPLYFLSNRLVWLLDLLSSPLGRLT